MRTIRRVGGMAIAGLFLTGVVGGPAASAAETQTKSPETYLGSAAGQALHLKIGATEASAGVSSVNLDSTLKAAAKASGTLGLPVGGSSAVESLVSADGAKDAKPQACATPALPSQLATVLTVGAACASSLAEVNAGLPHALGDASVFNLDLNVQTVTSQLPVSAVAQVLDQVLGGVGSLQQAVEAKLGHPIGMTETVDQLTTALLETKTLSVKLGASTSEVTTDGSKVTSVAKSAAGIIQLFPLGAQLQAVTGVEIKPIVEIEIGSSKASAVYDRATGASDATFDPSIVTIRVNTPLVDSLGQITGQTLNEIKIAPNLTPSAFSALLTPATAAVVQQCADASNEFCVLAGTPLETRIAVASGRKVQNPDGSVGAVADAVKVHTLRNIGTVVSQLNGGILLELAHTEAGVGGKPAETVTVAAPDIPRELPRTGGTPWLPIAAVAGVGIALIARRTLAKVAR